MYKHVIIQGYKHGRINVCLILHVFYDTLQTLPVSALFKTKKNLKTHNLQYWVHGLMVRHVDIAHKWLHSQWNDIN